jgi:hypothetical protein
LKRAWVLCVAGCATLAEAGGGDDNAPNANAGPFRALRYEELGGGHTAPYALRDDSEFLRDASVVDRDGDPATLGVFAIVARRRVPGGAASDPDLPTNELVRFDAEDGRSFVGEAPVVLAAAAGEEGGVLASPSAVLYGEGVRLYYATAAGIGLAESADGRAFTRTPTGTVLGLAANGWDAHVVPSSPSVVRARDGGWRMFYEANGALGEATSADGRVWVRSSAPVLVPAPGAAEVALHAPGAVWSRSSLGRDILWLYYASEAADGERTIEVAAREGDGEGFERAASPVFGMGSGLRPTEPSVVRFDGVSLLFVTERAGKGASQAYPAVACGVAPASLSLPAP